MQATLNDPDVLGDDFFDGLAVEIGLSGLADAGALVLARPPIRDVECLAALIRQRWSKAFESVLEVGALIAEAKRNYNKRDYRRFKKELPFSNSVAQRLRKIATSERITNPKYKSLMPFSWNTLAMIDTLDDDTFALAIENGGINPQCTWKAIKRLRDGDTERYCRKAAAEAAVAAKQQPPLGATAMKAPVGSFERRPLERNAEREKAREFWNRPVALNVYVAGHIMEHYLSDLERLVAALNDGRISTEYPFISEVRLVRK